MLTVWYYIDASLDTVVSEAFSLVDSSGRVHETKVVLAPDKWLSIYTQVNFQDVKSLAHFSFLEYLKYYSSFLLT